MTVAEIVRQIRLKNARLFRERTSRSAAQSTEIWLHFRALRSLRFLNIEKAANALPMPFSRMALLNGNALNRLAVAAVTCNLQ